ncbi:MULTISPECIES: Kazal-type serine protease inhibitor family protein [Brucella/Ochrobactrum group]|uniref:Protease inhibitor n=1 Tax=Ochrobactrum soli TaxID=2448455 RepID=A0A849KJ93_9HYPH|nr:MULTISPECIES: Kazal-type serine protease inhibitor [Brucella]MCI1000326.1 protease inhibitor [Ochrobactrum sp. C6C9]MDX4074217.1 Kazal-type serine protease inhibitor [Brucella sp. NBRC 113783]NNU61815.1 protease inhibitor [[Ochrobactrum] soli]RRD24982.1 protease inhibitor [Brucellaceae bacterium VT-16-1752]
MSRGLSWTGLIAGVMVLSGCVAEGGPDHRPPPVRPGNPGHVQACPMIYSPVCGESRGIRRTFGNACSARAEGFRVVSNGQCSSRPGSGWNGPGVGPARPPQHGVRPGMGACTREYAPVCARRGSERRSFSNRCEAERAGFRVTGGGRC